MLLRVGIVMVLLSLILAAGTAAFVGLRAYYRAAPVLSVEPRSAEIAPEEKTAPEKKEFDPGKKLEINDGTNQEPRPAPLPEPTSAEPRSKSHPPKRPVPADTSTEDPGPQESTPEAPTPEAPTPEEPATDVPDWPQPSQDEQEVAEQPRYFDPEPSAGMTLTIEAIGLYDVPVVTSDGLEPLDTGLWHAPETSLPWDGGAQRNVYIAGHYLGWPGTASRLVFYNLDKLAEGDEVLVGDDEGDTYRYRVSESFMAGPDESWVMGQVRGRDMLTLQTCIPPNFEDRLIVRADRA